MVNNNIVKSSYRLFTWEYYKNKNGWMDGWSPQMALTIFCLITGAVIGYKIVKNLLFTDNTIVNNLFKCIPLRSLGAKVISFLIGSLITILYAFQSAGLSSNIVNPEDGVDGIKPVKRSSYAIISIYSIIVCIGICTHQNWLFIFAIIFAIIYYVLITIIVSKLDCTGEGTSNKFKTNCYIDKVKLPMTYIIIFLLFGYVLFMSILRVFSKKTNNCIKEYTKLEKCIGNMAFNTPNTAATNSQKKILDNLKNIKGDIEKLGRSIKSQDGNSYKTIMAIIILNIIVILCGFNTLLWFVRPDVFITLLVFQRLWFGSTYAIGGAHNTNLSTSRTPSTPGVPGTPVDTPRLKSWDLVGMPFVRWAMYLSNIDTDTYDNSILYGETNRKTFNIWESAYMNKIKNIAYSPVKSNLKNIDPNK